jgi:hypothetical protein
MNFYYDPILGLQYTAFEMFIEFDLKYIPSNLAIEKFITEWYKVKLDVGFLPICSDITTHVTITSDFIK